MTNKKVVLKKNGEYIKTKSQTSYQKEYSDLSHQIIRNASKRSSKKNSHSRVKNSSKSLKKNQNLGKKTLKGGQPSVSGAIRSIKEGVSKRLKRTAKTMGRVKAKARGIVEGTIKAPQMVYRMNDIGSIYGFMPTDGEVKGNNLSNMAVGPRFTKDLYMNLKANLLLLSSVDHLTLSKMLLVNPEDVADFTRAYRHIKKKGASFNVVSDPKIFEKQNYMGMRTAQKLKSLKDEMKLMTEDSVVSEDPRLKGKIRGRIKGKPINYQPFKPEEEIKIVLQPDAEKYKSFIFDDGSSRRAEKSEKAGEESLGYIDHQKNMPAVLEDLTEKKD